MKELTLKLLLIVSISLSIFLSNHITEVVNAINIPKTVEDYSSDQQDLVYISESPEPVSLLGVDKSVSYAPKSSIVRVKFGDNPIANYQSDLSLKSQTNTSNSNATKQSQEFDISRPITTVVNIVTSIVAANLGQTPPSTSPTSSPYSSTTTTTTPTSTSTSTSTPTTTSTTTESTSSQNEESSNQDDNSQGPVGTKTVRKGNAVLCGEANPSGKSNKKLIFNRIIGGRKTEPGEFPFQVRLNIRSKRGTGICGGIVLDGNHILTAAHCMTACVSQNLNTATIEKTGLKITVGDHAIKSEDGEQEIEVDEIRPHEKYDACNFYSNDNDIAVIKTSQSMEYKFTSDGYGSVNRPCLPMSKDVEYREGEPAIVTGWGVTRENSGSLSNILRYVQVPLVNVTRCQETYGNRVTNDHVCAGFESGGKDSCQGDSGGPLVRVVENRYELVGIVSFGYGCGQPGAPGVYTRVASYLNWIKANL